MKTTRPSSASTAAAMLTAAQMATPCAAGRVGAGRASEAAVQGGDSGDEGMVCVAYREAGVSNTRLSGQRAARPGAHAAGTAGSPAPMAARHSSAQLPGRADSMLPWRHRCAGTAQQATRRARCPDRAARPARARSRCAAASARPARLHGHGLQLPQERARQRPCTAAAQRAAARRPGARRLRLHTLRPRCGTTTAHQAWRERRCSRHQRAPTGS